METTTEDVLAKKDFNKPVLPQTLNVLTILTIIGCSILFLLSLASPALMKFSKSMMDKADASEMTPRQIENMEKGKRIMELSENNMIPLMALGIVGIILCFIGALMMRKLKKDGYWIYLAGKVVPLFGGLFILGMLQFSGFHSMIMPFISLIFIIFYNTQ